MVILKSKNILTFVLIVSGIIVVSGIGYLVYSNISNTDNQQVIEEAPLFTGIELLSSLDIEKIENPDERFQTYVSTAADAKFNGDNNLAIEYYKLASKVEGVEVNYKQNTMLIAYSFATEINDTEAAEYFSTFLDKETIEEYEKFLEQIDPPDEQS